MKNKKNIVTSDERTLKNTGTAAAVTLALLWLALIIIGIIKGFKYGAQSTTEEILLFLGSLFVFLIFNHRKDEVDLPKTFFGKPLPSGVSKEEKRARIKAYVFDSIGNALLLSILNVCLNRVNPDFIYTTINFGGKTENFIINLLIDFLIMFALFMLINYFWGEHNIKKYDKLLHSDDDV